jgi:hypothetical protein
MTDYSELVERMRAYPANRLCVRVADALEAQDVRIAELEVALKKADDALSWLILETCDESYQQAYPEIYADLIDANIASRAALKGENDGQT